MRPREVSDLPQIAGLEIGRARLEPRALWFLNLYMILLTDKLTLGFLLIGPPSLQFFLWKLHIFLLLLPPCLFQLQLGDEVDILWAVTPAFHHYCSPSFLHQPLPLWHPQLGWCHLLTWWPWPPLHWSMQRLASCLPLQAISHHCLVNSTSM